MARDTVYEQKLVIMDSNYGGVLDLAVNMIFYVAGERNETIISSPLSLDHIDKQILKFRSTDEEMNIIQARIEELYPGLCVFNPPLYV